MDKRIAATVYWVDIDSVHPCDDNPDTRWRDDNQLTPKDRDLVESIRNGFRAPNHLIVIDNTIVDGNRRWNAAKRAGLDKIAVLYIDNIEGLSVADWIARLNSEDSSFTGEQWNDLYVKGADLIRIPKRYRKQIRTVETLCGRKGVEFLAKNKAAPDIINLVVRTVDRLKADRPNKKLSNDPYYDTMEWIITHGYRLKLRLYLKRGYEPDLLIHYIKNNQELPTI